VNHPDRGVQSKGRGGRGGGKRGRVDVLEGNNCLKGRESRGEEAKKHGKDSASTQRYKKSLRGEERGPPLPRNLLEPN